MRNRYCLKPPAVDPVPPPIIMSIIKTKKGKAGQLRYPVVEYPVVERAETISKIPTLIDLPILPYMFIRKK